MAPYSSRERMPRYLASERRWNERVPKSRRRKGWWSRQLERLIGPAIWLLARLIDRMMDRHH